MRYGVIIGIIVGLIGCGEVDLAITPDAGDGGTAETGGHAGTTGTGGAGGDNCVPDACNTCVAGKKMPVADDVACAPAECGGTAVSPFGGTYAPVIHKSVCHSGACVPHDTACDAQACNCGSVAVGYAGCFTDTGPAACKCVNMNGAYCE